MNIAQRIHKELNEGADLKLIKKIIAIYEKLNNENEDELMSYEEMTNFMDSLLGEETVRDKIKTYRDRESLTQKELALKAEIKQQHISEIERGLRPVGVATAKKLAKVLNCHYRSLL